MYVLDTNIVSELRRPNKAHPRVLAWASQTAVGSLFLSVVTVLELELGALQTARKDPKQGAAIRMWIDNQVLPQFEQRILPIDTAVAQRCAHLHVPDRRSERDALIAATALIHGMTVVTRNVRDFERTGVVTFNPWTA
jgi:toxin FitB